MKDAKILFKKAIEKKRPIRIKLLGDSITHGVGGTGWAMVGEPIVEDFKRSPDSFCWAKLFRDYMKEKYDAEVINNGCTGTTIQFIIEHFETLVSADDDLVICTIGTNNRHRSKELGERPSREEWGKVFYDAVLTLDGMFKAKGKRVIFVANRKEDIVFADVYFEVTGISEVTANALCVQNESIYLQSGDARIGLINNVRSEPCTVRTEDENGALIEAVHPDKKSVYGMAQIKGVWHEEGFVVEGMYLATVGSTLDIYTKYASCTITITSIEQK
jgi:hypothetical protein